jgi:hypothetical protein
MWVTKRSLREVAGIVVVDDRLPTTGPGWPRVRCRQCGAPVSYLVTGRVLRGREDVRLVGDAYCQFCTGPPAEPPYGVPIDPGEIVRIRL